MIQHKLFSWNISYILTHHYPLYLAVNAARVQSNMHRQVKQTTTVFDLGLLKLTKVEQVEGGTDDITKQYIEKYSKII